MALSKIKTGSVSDDLAVDTTTLVVDATNNRVGVGTASPNVDLEVRGSGLNGQIYIGGSTAAVYSQIYADNDGIVIIDADKNNQGSGSSLRFKVDGSEAARIDDSGNLLVGQTTKRGKVTLSYNTNTVSDPTVYVANDGGTAALITFGDVSGSITYGSITRPTSSSSVSYNTSSDHRLKENVVELTGATDRLKQLEPKRFNFIDYPDRTVDGFLAHEVSGIVPEAITGTHNEVDADGNPVYQGIDQSKLVPLLVATIKELEARIVALEGA